MPTLGCQTCRSPTMTEAAMNHRTQAAINGYVHTFCEPLTPKGVYIWQLSGQRAKPYLSSMWKSARRMPICCRLRLLTNFWTGSQFKCSNLHCEQEAEAEPDFISASVMESDSSTSGSRDGSYSKAADASSAAEQGFSAGLHEQLTRSLLGHALHPNMTFRTPPSNLLSWGPWCKDGWSPGKMILHCFDYPPFIPGGCVAGNVPLEQLQKTRTCKQEPTSSAPLRGLWVSLDKIELPLLMSFVFRTCQLVFIMLCHH